jgi:microcystin degradation protein MlrC
LTGAQPGGGIDPGFFADCLNEVETRLRDAGDIDGVYISQHGAMACPESDDPDGDFFAKVRDIVGADVPIVATLDLHANASRRYAELVDVIIAYRTNPHIDQRERGEEAAQVMHELLQGMKVTKAFVHPPIVPVSTSLLSATGPYAELIDYGQARKTADIINVTVLGGFAYADQPKQGLSIIVSARDNAEAARQLAADIARMAWENRERFVRKPMALEQAVELARRHGEDSSLANIIIAEVSDNPGGGGRSNTTALLKALYEAGVQGVILGNFFDPALAARAHGLGEGAEFEAHLNSAEQNVFSPPLDLPARVLALHDGTLVGTRGIYAGRTVDLGPCCALQVGGIGLLVTSRRIQCADPVFFTALGLDPAAARTVVVKSRGHFRAGFDLLFPPERIFEVDAPGLTTQNILQLDYRRFRRDAFPFDADRSWRPVADVVSRA